MSNVDMDCNQQQKYFGLTPEGILRRDGLLGHAEATLDRFPR